MNTRIRVAILILVAGLTGSLSAQTLVNLGGTAPTPGANDISQLSTQGNKTNPDGLNYFTDNYTSWGNGEPGQTFTTGANAGGYVLTSLALKTGGIGSASGTTTPQPYYLHIYSIAGSSATLLQTYTSGNVAFNDGDWLRWTGISMALSPNTTYAFSFGKASSTSSYAPLAVATNKYAGGEIAQIKPNTGGVTYGSSHTFDAVFDVGLVLATTPNIGAITISPWTNVPAGVPMTFTASVAGALPRYFQWQFNDGSGFVSVSGANTNPLSFVSAVTNTGSYRLVVTNSYGAVTSAPVAIAVSRGLTNIPASMPFPLPTYGFNIGNKLELGWGPPNPAVLYNAAYNGFNAVRIPCRWEQSATTNISGGVTNYPINPGYMAQVKQTVDAAVAAGLYVVINDHEQWMEGNITNYVDPIIDAKMQDLWTQIATTFAGYDNHLLFAGANEPNVHNDTTHEAVLMHYFQTFINAVRSTGGNNTNRWLVLQPMIDAPLVPALPTDTVSNRLMLEFHNYTPSLFSIIHSDQSWGTAIYYWGAAYQYTSPTNRNATWGLEYEHDAGYQQLADLFVSKGIPVMIGEYGASPSGRTDPTEKAYNEASVLYWDKYLTESAQVHGLSPFYWSTGGDPFDYDTGATTKTGPMIAVTGGAAPPPPNGAPYAASNLAATGGTNRVTLSWTAGSGATSYNLYRGTTSGGGSKTNPVVTGITGTSYTNTGLANGTTYYYQVVAVNASGISGYSPEAKAMTYADPSIPLLINLGGAAPVPGPNDISQLSTVGSQTSPDGLNYYTDNGSPAGQTFTTPAKALNLVSVAIKTAGLNNGNGYGTPASTPTLYLRIYSMSGNTATLLKTFSAPNPGYTDGAWLRWSNINVALSPSQTYAYSFGNKPTAGGWAALSVASANTYTGGQVALIPISGGGITTGGSHNFDATFVLGLVTNTPPALAAITNRTVNVGETVAFTASTTDTDWPPQTLTFALLAGATNATFNTNSGAFSFRPLVTQANSSNNFTLKVSDNGTPSLSATQSFAVVVNPLVAPSVSDVSVAGGQFSFSIDGQSGSDYAVETSTNLTQWSNVFITNSPALPFDWTDPDFAAPMRFYRIKLGPPLP